MSRYTLKTGVRAMAAALLAGLACAALPAGAVARSGTVARSRRVARSGGVAARPVPIPEGSALWFACTEPVFDGPLTLGCPLPYTPHYLETFLSGFDRFTPENEFKMMFLEPAMNHFDFALADEIARFAISYGKTIRGHTLLWDQENPLWLTHPLLPWSRAALIATMRAYISGVVGHFARAFPGVVTEWDVVNEPLSNWGSLTANTWERVIGQDYIRIALDAAHAADPNAQLVINDDNADHPGPHETALLALATSLRQAGAPLNAVGFEEHVTPETTPTLRELVTLWRRYAAIGVHVEVTELDVNNDPGTVESPAAKAAVFDRFAQACRQAGNCTGLTVWGVADAYSWLGPSTTALLYDSAFAPTVAVGYVHDVLAGLPQPGLARKPIRTHHHR